MITHNDVGYWTRYWTRKDPSGMISEYSKSDSIVKDLDEYWAYVPMTHRSMGINFRISEDTLFEYDIVKVANARHFINDTIPIASYSKNKIVLKNGVEWHRISTRYARKMINLPTQVKLSSLLREKDSNKEISDIADVLLRNKASNKEISDIVGVAWKLYGYGDVSTGIVSRSKSLKDQLHEVIIFRENGTIFGVTASTIRGAYTLSGSNISELYIEYVNRSDYNDRFQKDDIFYKILPQCWSFIITNNWLQLFYDNGKKYLLFTVSPVWK